MMSIHAVLLAGCLIAPTASDLAKDSDGDGLTDFHERHKHLTDPSTADSDGDGTPDGDWLERREYQYTVRSVVQVMKPVTVEYLTDDYQDVRVLDETDTYVELEVIHYPFNTVAETLSADETWRRPDQRLQEWLEPGPTSDWTPALRKQILADLKTDGIDASQLNDRELVERVSGWLLKRAAFHDGFSSFITAFDEQGRAFVPDDLRKGRDLDELRHQWDREVSAAGMYEHRQRGSCTSSAIYLSGCLRAVGIPTRTVLCIPLIDASDEREMHMVRTNIRHSEVRRTLLTALSPLRNSWASHTFNEVYVGHRWRRLNYDRLGQNIYEPSMFGLMTHVATFRDWADAKMHTSVGRRQIGTARDDVFGGSNPYSTISLRDTMGPHCRLELPPERDWRARITRVHWTDSQELPPNILAGLGPRGRFGLLMVVEGFEQMSEFHGFVKQADLRVLLEAPDHTLKVGFDPNCFWFQQQQAFIYVPFGAADRRDLQDDVAYRVVARNDMKGFEWVLPKDVKVVRK